MKFLSVFAALLLTSPFASAQVLISDFSDIGAQAFTPFNQSWNGGSPLTDQYVQNSGNISITAVNGGSPTGQGSFDAVFPGSNLQTPASVDLSGTLTLDLTARVDAGNTNSSLTIVLDDNQGIEIGSATFLTSEFTTSFSTVDAVFTPIGGGNISQAAVWTLSGDASPNDNVRMSFDNLTASSAAVP